MKAERLAKGISVIGVLAFVSSVMLAQGSRFLLDDEALATAIADNRGSGFFQFSLIQEKLARGNQATRQLARPAGSGPD
jgi:hypothetical protein